MSKNSELTPITTVLVLVTGFAGLAVAGVGAFNFACANPLLIGTLAAFTILLDRVEVPLFHGSKVTASTGPVLTAGILCGLGGLVVVLLAAQMVSYALRPKPWYKITLTTGALLVAGAAFITTLKAFPFGGEAADWPELLVPVMAGMLMHFGVNSVIVGAAIAASTGQRFQSVWFDNFRTLPQHYIVMGGITATMASASNSAGHRARPLYE